MHRLLSLSNQTPSGESFRINTTNHITMNPIKCKAVGCRSNADHSAYFCTSCMVALGTERARSFPTAKEQLPLDAENVSQVTVPGRKDDTGKLDITLLFDDLPHALEAVTEVLQWAITKKEPIPYVRGSWKGVQPLQMRYRAAQLRHMLNAAKHTIAQGEASHLSRDHETNLLELAHIATDAMFQLEMACRELNGYVPPCTP